MYRYSFFYVLLMFGGLCHADDGVINLICDDKPPVFVTVDTINKTVTIDWTYIGQEKKERYDLVIDENTIKWVKPPMPDDFMPGFDLNGACFANDDRCKRMQREISWFSKWVFPEGRIDRRTGILTAFTVTLDCAPFAPEKKRF